MDQLESTQVSDMDCKGSSVKDCSVFGNEGKGLHGFLDTVVHGWPVILMAVLPFYPFGSKHGKSLILRQ